MSLLQPTAHLRHAAPTPESTPVTGASLSLWKCRKAHPLLRQTNHFPAPATPVDPSQIHDQPTAPVPLHLRQSRLLAQSMRADSPLANGASRLYQSLAGTLPTTRWAQKARAATSAHAVHPKAAT